MRNLVSKHMRKLAHFLEYSFFGLEMVIIVRLYVENKKKGVFLSLLAGFAVAAMDEFLQRFSGRGSCFTDVLIDFAGFSIGFLLYYGIAVGFVKLSEVFGNLTASKLKIS